jgi:hypothetical protein
MGFGAPPNVSTKGALTADRLENHKVTDCHFVRFEPEKGPP